MSWEQVRNYQGVDHFLRISCRDMKSNFHEKLCPEMDRIPDDVLMEILGYLTHHRDIFLSKLVCKKWFQLIPHSIVVVDCEGIGVSTTLIETLAKFPRLRILDVSLCKSLPCFPPTLNHIFKSKSLSTLILPPEMTFARIFDTDGFGSELYEGQDHNISHYVINHSVIRVFREQGRYLGDKCYSLKVRPQDGHPEISEICQFKGRSTRIEYGAIFFKEVGVISLPYAKAPTSIGDDDVNYEDLIRNLSDEVASGINYLEAEVGDPKLLVPVLSKFPAVPRIEVTSAWNTNTEDLFNALEEAASLRTGVTLEVFFLFESDDDIPDDFYYNANRPWHFLSDDTMRSIIFRSSFGDDMSNRLPNLTYQEEIKESIQEIKGYLRKNRCEDLYDIYISRVESEGSGCWGNRGEKYSTIPNLRQKILTYKRILEDIANRRPRKAPSLRDGAVK